jgi:hypothetical protein
MKTGTAIVVLSVLLIPAVRAADDPDREKYISTLESLFFKTTLLSANSPFVSNLLGPAKSANPGVSDDAWTSVASELAIAFDAVLKERGGLTDTALRSAVQEMSTRELEHLTAILSDPVFQKYSAATRSAAAQKQLARALMETTVKLKEALNGILRERGLKEVH